MKFTLKCSRKYSVLCLLGLLSWSHLDAHVDLITPASGKAFQPGDMVNISWENVIDHFSINWDLLFSADGGATWDTIQQDIPIDVFSYQWTVPEIYTNQAWIKVVQDNPGENYKDVSGDFTIYNPVGVFNKNLQPGLKIYPNPFTDFVIFEVVNLGYDSFDLILFDLGGREVLAIADISASSVVINRASLPSGFYSFSLFADQHLFFTGKLVVN